MTDDTALQRLARLAQLARDNPAALSPDGWRRLEAAGHLPAERDKGGFIVSGTWVPSLDGGPGTWERRDQVERLATELARGNSALYGLVQTYLRHYRQAPLRCWHGPFMNLPASRVGDVHGVTGLVRAPSEWWRFGEIEAWRRTMMLLDGNAYLIKRRAGGRSFVTNTSGRVTGLDLVSPAVMWPERAPGSKNLIDHYALHTGYGGAPLKVPRQNVIHFRHGLDADLMRGVGPVKALAREVVTDDEADVYILAYLKNLGAPGLFFAPKEVGLPVDQEAVEARLRTKVTGTHRGEPIVFKTPVDFHQFATTTDAMNLEHVRRHIETRMAAAVGVPAVLAQLGAGLDSATYSNVASFIRQFNETTVMSAWSDDGETWTQGLGPDFGFGADDYLAYDWTAVKALQDDLNELWERTTALWERDGLTLGQLHQILDLGPVPEGRAELRHSDLQGRPAVPGSAPGAAAADAAADAIDAVDADDGVPASDRGKGGAYPAVDAAAVRRAIAAWPDAVRTMPGRSAAAGVLGATRTKGDAGWSYDPTEARYSAAGTPLSDDALWDLVSARQDVARERMRGWTEELRDGAISLETWRTRMGTEILDAILQLHLLVVGGSAGLTDDDLAAVRPAVTEQWKYLAAFSEAIRTAAISWPQALARAALYAGSALRSVFARGLVSSRRAAGYTQKRRVGPADGDTCRDCWDEILRGWVDINEPGWEIGRGVECGPLDRCRIVVRRSPERSAP